jgi:hypothetical protein
MDEKAKVLVGKLTKKTNEGCVVWSETARDIFRVTLPSAKVHIGIPGEYERIERYRLKVSDSAGNEVYTQEVSENGDEECLELLRELYCAAKGAFYNVKDVFEGLIKELESNDIVGKESGQESNNN